MTSRAIISNCIPKSLHATGLFMFIFYCIYRIAGLFRELKISRIVPIAILKKNVANLNFARVWLRMKHVVRQIWTTQRVCIIYGQNNQGRNHQIRIGQAKFLLTINNRLFNNSSNNY